MIQLYNYNRGRDITNKVKCAYTADALGTVRETIPYTYGDSNWKDKLTAYNGTAITYNAIGNPLNDGNWTYEWAVGRQLKKMSREGQSLTFKYDHNGMRIQKVLEHSWYPETTNYTYHGKLLTHMEVAYTDFDEVEHTDKLHFFYDAQSRPAKVSFNGTVYTYVHNLRGDVVGLLDNSGTLVVEYKYDAWGKPIATTGSLTDALGVCNPFRYRGYIFDEETGVYYLKDRYYSLDASRFLSADILLGAADSVLLQNVFAYAGNAPVDNADFDGKCIFALIGGIVGAVTGAIYTAVSGGSAREVLASAAGGFVSGAFSGAVLDASVATGGLSLLASGAICGLGNAAGECVTQLISKGSIDDGLGVAIAFGTGAGFGAISAAFIPNVQSTLKPLSDMAYKEAFSLLDMGVPMSTVSSICDTIGENVRKQAVALIANSIAYNTVTQVADTAIRNKISNAGASYKSPTVVNRKSLRFSRFAPVDMVK